MNNWINEYFNFDTLLEQIENNENIVINKYLFTLFFNTLSKIYIYYFKNIEIIFESNNRRIIEDNK